MQPRAVNKTLHTILQQQHPMITHTHIWTTLGFKIDLYPFRSCRFDACTQLWTTQIGVAECRDVCHMLCSSETMTCMYWAKGRAEGLQALHNCLEHAAEGVSLEVCRA